MPISKKITSKLITGEGREIQPLLTTSIAISPGSKPPSFLISITAKTSWLHCTCSSNCASYGLLSKTRVLLLKGKEDHVLFCSKLPIASTLTQRISQSPHNGLQRSTPSVPLSLPSVLISYYSFPHSLCSKSTGFLPMPQKGDTCSYTRPRSLHSLFLWLE